MEKYRSLNNKSVSCNVTIGNNYNYCRRNGSNHGIESYCKRWYILGLLILVCKGRDVQSIIGQSYGNSTINIGTMNIYGLLYDKYTYACGVKCFEIENILGNIKQWIVGILFIPPHN